MKSTVVFNNRMPEVMLTPSRKLERGMYVRANSVPVPVIVTQAISRTYAYPMGVRLDNGCTVNLSADAYMVLDMEINYKQSDSI